MIGACAGYITLIGCTANQQESYCIVTVLWGSDPAVLPSHRS